MVEKFKVLGETSFEYISRHADLRAIVTADPGIFTLSPSEDRFLEVNASARGLIADVLRQGMDEGRFHPMNIEATTEFLFSVYMMFLIKEFVKTEGGLIPSMIEEGPALILRGLLKANQTAGCPGNAD